MYFCFCVVAHGLMCFTVGGITAEIMSLNYGGFLKVWTGEKYSEGLDSFAERLACAISFGGRGGAGATPSHVKA
jgi:hypothetical protein